MPIYEYVCAACRNRLDILLGFDDPGPGFCPNCGAEGTMSRAFAPPAIHFKGSGWAKKDRGSGSRTKAAAKSDSGTADTKADAAGGAGSESKATGSSAAAGASSDD